MRLTLQRAICALATVAASASAVSCGGGGGGGAAKPMVLVELLFVDRALVPRFQTGVKDLPRNAQIELVFSELVDPASVNQESVAIRFGPQFQSVPKGAFKIDSNIAIFDPTLTAQGTPNPFGFDAGVQFNMQLFSVTDNKNLPAGKTVPVVRNLDNDPLLTSFFTSFTTSDKFLRELDPPSVVSVDFVPAPNPVTRQIPGGGVMRITFTEAMDPNSLVLSSTNVAPLPTDTIDVRYRNLSPDPNVNTLGLGGPPGIYGNELTPISGTFTHDPSATVWTFTPTFSFGNAKFDFAVAVLQGVKDLAGNGILNPRSFGPYICDGTGRGVGRTLVESFDNQGDNDTGVSNSDWGQTVAGQLQGAAITTRRVRIFSYDLFNKYGGGQYFEVYDPLVGVLLNSVVPGINPPTSSGRHVIWTFGDDEMGQNGTITVASWGPGSNATFAALYPTVTLRVGFQKTNSMSLGTSFTGNYLGSPLIMYTGSYSVSQKANVGNEITPPATPGGFIGAPNPYPTGFVNWPALSSFFDWDEGDTSISLDSVLVFAASVDEGDTWQQFRTYWGGQNGLLVAGVPTRRMLSTFEGDGPDPQANAPLGILNPEPSCTDTAFTLTRLKSLAQVRFYTPDPIDPGFIAFPAPYSASRTFGTKSDYLNAVLVPAVQAGGAQVLMEFYGATSLDPASNRTLPNLSFAVRNWTTNINDCDVFPYIRWRATLTSNLATNSLAKLQQVTIPLVKLP